MIYDDGTGKRIYSPLRGSPSPPEDTPEPTDAVREAILRVAKDHPRWGPRQIYAELRFTRHDIPVAVVMTVLADLERTSRGARSTIAERPRPRTGG
jgi:hypothetical protein